MYSTRVQETILEHLPKNTLTLHNFCIWYPNVAFFGALKPHSTCQQKTHEQSNNIGGGSRTVWSLRTTPTKVAETVHLEVGVVRNWQS